MHGTLQGRLASLPEPTTAGDAVRETLALLQTGGAPIMGGQLCDVVATALQPWQSLLAIEITCPEEHVAAPVAQAITEVLEECAANAFRHGRASDLICTATCMPESVHLVITDTGHGLAHRTETQGLGSRILDRCGVWTRTYATSGTTVDIVIPR